MLRRLAIALGLAVALGPSPSAEPVVPPKVLLLVGEGPLRPGDELLGRRLVARGYAVAVGNAASLEAGSWAGQDAVVLSSSVDAAAGERLRAADVPLVVLQPLLYGRLGLAGDGLGADFGIDSTLGRTGITIHDAQHPLAGGVDAEVRVATRPVNIGWARPSSGAIVVASLSGAPDRVVAFAYAPRAS